MPTGKVKWYDADKGFGFLTQDDGGDVYVRSDALPEGVTTLKAGARVEFGIAQGRRGDQALQVRVLEPVGSVSRSQAQARRKAPEEMVADRRGPHPPARRHRRGLPARPSSRPQGGQAGRAAAACTRHGARQLRPQQT